MCASEISVSRRDTKHGNQHTLYTIPNQRVRPTTNHRKPPFTRSHIGLAHVCAFMRSTFRTLYSIQYTTVHLHSAHWKFTRPQCRAQVMLSPLTEHTEHRIGGQCVALSLSLSWQIICIRRHELRALVTRGYR